MGERWDDERHASEERRRRRLFGDDVPERRMPRSARETRELWPTGDSRPGWEFGPGGRGDAALDSWGGPPDDRADGEPGELLARALQGRIDPAPPHGDALRGQIAPREPDAPSEMRQWAERLDVGRPPRAGTGPYAGRGPRGWRRADDRIFEDVCQRLTDDPDVDANGITVRVDDGEVTLEGTVPTRAMKRLAEDSIEDLPGVRDVQNRLRVEPTPTDVPRST
jgi:hypothetical protein